MKASFFILTALVLFVYSVNEIQRDYTANYNAIGKQLIIQRDTLIILNYSFFDGSYSLSNGTTINSDLAHKLIINK